MTVVQPFTHGAVSGCKFGTAPVGKPILFSHVYYVDGLLVDTGHARARKQVYEWASKFDCQKIVLTHFHEDHSGNAALLRGQLNVPVYASELCCEIMEHPPKLTNAQRLVWGNRRAMRGLEPLSSTLETENHQFSVIPVPGHSPDMVVLHEPEQGWLFAADLYVSPYIKYFIVYESMRQQIASIKKVLELDFEVLFCGHNLPILNGHEKLREKLAFFEDFYGRVAELGAQGLSAEEIYSALELREPKVTYYLSGGYLSQLNMVRSVLRDEIGWRQRVC